MDTAAVPSARLSRVVSMLTASLKDGDSGSTSGIFTRRDNLSALLQVPEQSSPDADSPATGGPWLTDSSSVSDLGWLIPAIVVGIFAMLGIAFACNLGVRRLELRMLNWCRQHFPCCCCPDEESEGLLTRGGLSGSSRKEIVRLKDFRERAPSYGVTRDRHEEYVPRKTFNPFDEQ